MSGLVGLLLALLVVGIIIYAIVLVMRKVPLDPDLKQIVWLIVAVIALALIWGVLNGGGMPIPVLKP